jgi:hypothetical protein
MDRMKITGRIDVPLTRRNPREYGSHALARKAERDDVVEFYDASGNARDGRVVGNYPDGLSVMVGRHLVSVPHAMVSGIRRKSGFDKSYRSISRRPYRRNPFKRRTRGKRSGQAKSSRPSKRTRYRRRVKLTEVSMAKRRRRNSPITAKQASVLRSILSAHGYRVGKKRRKAKRKAKRSAHRRVARRVKAPKRLRSGTSFKRRGRKYVVVSRVVRVNGRKIRIRYARKR